MNVMFLLNINPVQRLFPYIKLLFCKYVQISRSFIVSVYLQAESLLNLSGCAFGFLCKHWGRVGWGGGFKRLKHNRLTKVLYHMKELPYRRFLFASDEDLPY